MLLFCLLVLNYDFHYHGNLSTCVLQCMVSEYQERYTFLNAHSMELLSAFPTSLLHTNRPGYLSFPLIYNDMGVFRNGTITFLQTQTLVE